MSAIRALPDLTELEGRSSDYRVSAQEDQLIVGRSDLEGGAVRLGGGVVVAGALALARDADPGVHAVVGGRLRLGLRDRVAERLGGLGGPAQARQRHGAVVVTVEALLAEPGDLVEREQGGRVVAALELGEAQTVVRVAAAV